VSVSDRWHLSRPPAGAKTCGKHRGKVASAEHEIGLRWQVRGIDDRRMPVKRNFEYEDDAKAYDAELKATVRAGTYVDEKAGQVTFREYAEEWRRTRRKQGHSTAERVERDLRNHCYPVIGDVPMAVLGRRLTVTRDWIAGLQLQPNSARLLIGRVSAIFKAAIDDRVMARNPLKAGSVESPDVIKADVIAWPPETVEDVAALLPDRLAAMAFLGAVTGMRQGELFGLALPSVDWLRCSVRVEAQVIQVAGGLAFGPVKNWRTRKFRDVPVAANIVPLLSQHYDRFGAVEVTLPWSQKGHRLDGKPVTRRLLFADGRGTAYYRQTVNREWRKAWHAAGVADMGRANGMHVLRHTAASHWLSKGLNVAKVADYLGDTVAVVLETYAHWMPADDDLGRAIMDGFLNPGNPGSRTSNRPHNALGSA
jgi:integrase